MQHATWIVCFAATIASSFALRPAEGQSEGGWDVVLNGRAVHMNASGDWNEDNWGLGMEREFASSSPWVKVALINGFEDSMGDPSYMAAGSSPGNGCPLLTVFLVMRKATPPRSM